MAKLRSIIGIDGSGKDFWLKASAAHFHRSPGVLPLYCTKYHDAPYCHAPVLSKLLYKLGLLADGLGDASLKAMSLFLKMMLFKGEFQHLHTHYQAAVVVSTRHPAIDTVVYSQLFIKNIPLGRPAEENHLLRAKGLLEEAEWKLLENFIGQSTAQQRSGSLEKLVLEIGQLDIAGQIQAYAQVFGVPLPDKILFLNPTLSHIQQNLASREDAVPEIHEQAMYLQALQQHFHSCLKAIAQTMPDVEIREIVPTFEVKPQDTLAFLIE